MPHTQIFTAVSHTACLALLACLIVPGQAQSDVIVHDGEIKDSGWVYTLDHEQLSAPDEFEADKHSKRNVRVLEESNGVRSVACWGGNAANTVSEIVYRFDFSQSTHRPTSLSVTDNVALLENDNSASADDLSVIIEISTDGLTWQDMRTVRSAEVFRLSVKTTTIPLDKPDSLYYRVRFEPTADDGDGIITHPHAHQWNRQKQDGSIKPFTARFELE